MTKHLAAARVEELLSKLEVRRYARELVVATLITGIEANHSDVQDMYTRLLPANLDFDSELQHVFCWAPGECRDSRVFYFDRVFSVFIERCPRVRFGCIECHTWVGSFDEYTRFSWSRCVFFRILLRLSCPRYRCCLVDSGGNLLNTWL